MSRKFEAKADGNGAIAIAGLGAAFGNVDSYDDVIKKGAFTDTLREWQARGKWPPMLLQHGGGLFGGGADDMVPIGQWEDMREEDAGLYVRGTVFNVETDRARATAAALRSSELDGLSIGFRTRKYEIDAETGIRTLTNIELWEQSIVLFPANDRARISSVKSAAGDARAEILALLDQRSAILRGDSRVREADQLRRLLAARENLWRTDATTRQRGEGSPMIERCWIHPSEEERRGRKARTPAASSDRIHARVDAMLARQQRIDATYRRFVAEENLSAARAHVAELVAKL